MIAHHFIALPLVVIAGLSIVSSTTVNAVCDETEVDVNAECSNPWDRLWDIRWRVCGNPESFGFNQGVAKTIFVQNEDCPDRGILFGSNSNGRLKHCYDATRAVLEGCLQNNCDTDCHASGTAHIKGGEKGGQEGECRFLCSELTTSAPDTAEVYQPVRYLGIDGMPISLVRTVTDLVKRNETQAAQIHLIRIPSKSKDLPH